MREVHAFLHYPCSAPQACGDAVLPVCLSDPRGRPSAGINVSMSKTIMAVMSDEYITRDQVWYRGNKLSRIWLMHWKHKHFSLNILLFHPAIWILLVPVRDAIS